MTAPVAPTPQLRGWGWGVTVASLLAIGWATLLPELDQVPGNHLCLICGTFGGVDALLNVILFMPLGVGLALLGCRATRAIAVAFALSAVIELAQLLVVTGRDATIGDVLMNTVGGALGFALTRYAASWLRPSPGEARRLIVWASVFWLLVQGACNYAFSVSLPASQYYGQLARALGRWEVFAGKIYSARVDGIAIPNAKMSESEALRAALLQGGPVVAAVTSAGATRGTAPIVRIADDSEREILLFAQRGNAALFGVRTGAAILRLRRPQFLLPTAFPSAAIASNGADTIILTGRYTGLEAGLSARSRADSVGTQLPIFASLGWILILPFDWFLHATRLESILSIVWTAILLIPLGYWAGLAAISGGIADSQLRRVSFGLALTVFVVFFGLTAIPMAFNLRIARPMDFLAAAIGVVIGLAVSKFSKTTYLPSRSIHD